MTFSSSLLSFCPSDTNTWSKASL